MAKRTKEEESESEVDTSADDDSSSDEASAEEQASAKGASSSGASSSSPSTRPRDEDEDEDEDESDEEEDESDDEEDASDEEEDGSDDDEEVSSDEEAKPSEARGAKPSARKVAEDADDEASDEEIGEKASLAAREKEDEEEAVLPTQLGTQRYIFSAYLIGGTLMAYVIGRTIHGIWSHYANRDQFVAWFPSLAAVSDESKQTYSTVVAALISLAFVIRTYRKPDVKQWTEEVTTEISKVKWPSRKEVTNATIVVIAASAIATTYLFLLDRLWAFVTGLVYGAGT
jgi:preprotein translocase subunit SecE